jgi:LPXTG-motif cell wall-anchored protein
MGNATARIPGFSGVVMMLSGAALLMSAGFGPAQAATRHARHTTTPTTACSHQSGLNDPTNSTSAALSSYSFSIQHGSSSPVAACKLQGLQPGDIVTATFSVASGAHPVVSLVSYTAPPASANQTLVDCATFGGGGTCTQSSTPTLTVSVPTCHFQVDLIYGTPTTSNVLGTYFKNHVWITGQAGDRTAACTASSPSPSPTSGVQGTITTGVEAAVTTPSTGAADGATGRMVLGLLLLTGGAGLVVRSRRRR